MTGFGGMKSKRNDNLAKQLQEDGTGRTLLGRIDYQHSWPDVFQCDFEGNAQT